MYRLGATFAIEVIPMVKAVSRHPELGFEWYSWNDLISNFLDGRLDAILSPPIVAVDLPGTIVVPGVGISSRGKIPSPVMYVRGAVDEIKELGIRAKFTYWKKWTDVVFASLRIGCDRVYIVENGRLFEKEAIIDCSSEMIYYKANGYNVINLGELWEKLAPNFPLVCWVWICHKGPDHRQIRMLLGKVWEQARENLFECLQRKDIGSDIALSEGEFEVLGDIYYKVASAEVDGIRWFLEHAKELGLINKDIDFVLC